jgi:uncharacterized protein YbaR (Trm112 family)
MQKYLIDMLTCPVCHAELDWRITRQTNERVEDQRHAVNPVRALIRFGRGLEYFLSMKYNEMICGSKWIAD